jgi:hypothetical protein
MGSFKSMNNYRICSVFGSPIATSIINLANWFISFFAVPQI